MISVLLERRRLIHYAQGCTGGWILLLFSAACNSSPSPDEASGSHRQSTEKVTVHPHLPNPKDAVELASGAATEKTSPPTTAMNAAAPTCLNRQQVKESGDMGVSFMINGPLSVVRVAPDDFLNLRAEASAQAPIITRLNPRQPGLQPTGTVCKTQEGVWYKLNAGVHQGFANGSFLRPATKAKNAAKQVGQRLGTKAFHSPQELINALKRSYEKNRVQVSEGKYVAKIFGPHRTGDDASAELFTCCELDDSEAGEQLSVEMAKQKAGWVLKRATSRTICYRGVTNDGKTCL